MLFFIFDVWSLQYMYRTRSDFCDVSAEGNNLFIINLNYFHYII